MWANKDCVFVLEADIRAADKQYLPKWLSLSREYDRYAVAPQPGLAKWYEGGKGFTSLKSYMKAKVHQGKRMCRLRVLRKASEKALELLRADFPIRINVVKSYLSILKNIAAFWANMAFNTGEMI